MYTLVQRASSEPRGHAQLKCHPAIPAPIARPYVVSFWDISKGEIGTTRVRVMRVKGVSQGHRRRLPKPSMYTLVQRAWWEQRGHAELMCCQRLAPTPIVFVASQVCTQSNMARKGFGNDRNRRRWHIYTTWMAVAGPLHIHGAYREHLSAEYRRELSIVRQTCFASHIYAPKLSRNDPGPLCILYN